MNKTMLTICGCALFSLLACNQTKSDKQDVPAKDTTVVAQTDSAAQAEPSELAKPEKVYYSADLQLLDLKGDVVSCKFKGECDAFNNWESTTTFDENGQIAKVDGKKLNLVRDDKGRITKYKYTEEDDMGETTEALISYKYDEQGRLASSFSSNAYAEWTRKVKYDEAGNVKSYTTTGPDGSVSKVSILSTDDKGNWTKRKCGGTTETRKITYRQ